PAPGTRAASDSCRAETFDSLGRRFIGPAAVKHRGPRWKPCAHRKRIEGLGLVAIFPCSVLDRYGYCRPGRGSGGGVRVFFATDIHGSEVCWRKFLNAGKFHNADVLVMGGDMTGKAMVPIVAVNGGWRLTLQDQEHVLSTEDEVRAMEKRILDRGYYPMRLTTDEVAAWKSDAALVDARFKAEMVANVARWMALADERLKGTGIRCVVSP